MYANGPILTKTVGTVCYAAPELLTSGMLTRAADVYSFGAPGLLLCRHCTAYTVRRVLDPCLRCSAGYLMDALPG